MNKKILMYLNPTLISKKIWVEPLNYYLYVFQIVKMKHESFDGTRIIIVEKKLHVFLGNHNKIQVYRSWKLFELVQWWVKFFKTSNIFLQKWT